jgi:beta-phosphoglucomutase-like phosphatase (HAD superfamily)
MQQLVGTPIAAHECLVIEDDPKGVEAGFSAGMNVIHRAIGDDDVRGFLEKIKSYL